jgi:hypothetical protein
VINLRTGKQFFILRGDKVSHQNGTDNNIDSSSHQESEGNSLSHDIVGQANSNVPDSSESSQVSQSPSSEFE